MKVLYSHQCNYIRRFLKILALALLFESCSHTPVNTSSKTMIALDDNNTTQEKITDNKIIIYQLLPRLFGNTKDVNLPYGTIEQNGCGKFNDINNRALSALKNMGISHIWLTGALEHATMTDYSAYGIAKDDADVVKGRAGSPYAIKDYYDVNPDLAENVVNRMEEFNALVQRIHNSGMKVIIDFVPNHVARRYQSDAKPAGVKDLGETDDKTIAFIASNNFYYLPQQKFIVPADYNPLGKEHVPGEDQLFDEYPAKVTGNDVFSPSPSKDDWFETVKLNYGVDIRNNGTKHFDPTPDTWNKMTDILLYWAGRGIDGFRCDMAEMVPVEFWQFAITKVKDHFPDVKFIAEIYNPAEYRSYIENGKFDYLYDKVGIYDATRRLIEDKGNLHDITHCWKDETNGMSNHMLRFLENHDEQRIASSLFAGTPQKAYGAMVLMATLGSGPLLIYSGQETGETGEGSEGFGGNDGRTSIFDYWSMPSVRSWVNNRKYDGGQLTEEQKKIRQYYSSLLNFCSKSAAVRSGYFYELQEANASKYTNNLIYSYIRYHQDEVVLFIINFSSLAYEGDIFIPAEIIKHMGISTETRTFNDLISNNTCSYNPTTGMHVALQPKQSAVIGLR